MGDHSPVVEVVRPADGIVPGTGQWGLTIIKISPAGSPLKRHHDSQTNGEVEYDVVDGIEKLGEQESVEFPRF